MFAIALITGSYLLGAVPFGYLVGRLRGVDVRAVGSRNIGTSNVHRSVGPGAAVVVLLLDAAKGAAAVVAARALGQAPLIQGAAGLASIVGHNWPVYLGFRGGRGGIATSLGVLIALVPAVAAWSMAVFLVVLSTSRYVSLASLCAAITLPVLLYLYDQPGSIVGVGCVMTAFAVYRHLPNIRRLGRGTEYRFGQRVEGPR